MILKNVNCKWKAVSSFVAVYDTSYKLQHIYGTDFDVLICIVVSHTTDDLVFEWQKELPLEVEPIELPQLQLVSNRTDDCTQNYSTGTKCFMTPLVVVL